VESQLTRDGGSQSLQLSHWLTLAVNCYWLQLTACWPLICCWYLPALLFLVPSPTEPVNIIYSSQSQSYITTDRQSANLSWCQAPIWGPKPDFYYCQTVVDLLMWSVLSDERRSVVYNYCWPSPAKSFLARNPRGNHDHIFLSQIRDCPNLECQVPYLCPPGTRWPSYNHRHWIPFSLPPTTRRAEFHVFEPSSTPEPEPQLLYD
jgi:hypothetical protein